MLVLPPNKKIEEAEVGLGIAISPYNPAFKSKGTFLKV